MLDFSQFSRNCHHKEQNLLLNFTYMGLERTELDARFLAILKNLPRSSKVTPERGELIARLFLCNFGIVLSSVVFHRHH